MYQVRLHSQAISEVTTAYDLASPVAQQAIIAALELIEERLRTVPWIEGESRSRGRRVCIAAPLTVLYRIEPDRQTVSILHAHVFRRRGD